MNINNLSRRSVLLGAAATGVGLATPNLLRAASGQVIVGTWGGDYATLLEQNVAPLVAEATGDKLLLDTGSSSARKTKMLAARQTGMGDMDVACISDSDIHQMSAQGLLTPISDLDIPNNQYVYDTFRNDFAVPHMYSALVIVYDPSQVDKAPTSIRDLWSDDYKGAVGFSDILFNVNLMYAAMAFGGGRSDFAPGREALDELKQASGVKVYASNEAIANAFHAKEIKATLMWKARAVQWQNAGLSVASVVPSEGGIPVLFELAVTSFAQNTAGAAATLNAVLTPEVQLASAKAMGYLPTVSNAPVEKEMREYLGFSDAERESFVSPDYEYIAQQLETTTTWWNQQFKV